MSQVSVLKTAPADYPITLAEAKAQLKIEPQFTEDDIYITSLIAAVTDLAQVKLQRQLMQATWYLYLDYWNDLDQPSIVVGYKKSLSGVYLKLPRNPVVGINSVQYLTDAITYADVNNAIYQKDLVKQPAQIRFTGSLPTLFDAPNAVRIEYVAGYGNANDLVTAQQAAIPNNYKLWIKAHVATCYQNRQTIVAGKLDNINDYIDGLLTDRMYL